MIRLSSAESSSGRRVPLRPLGIVSSRGMADRFRVYWITLAARAPAGAVRSARVQDLEHGGKLIERRKRDRIEDHLDLPDPLPGVAPSSSAMTSGGPASGANSGFAWSP